MLNFFYSANLCKVARNRHKWGFLGENLRIRDVEVFCIFALAVVGSREFHSRKMAN